MPTKVEIKGCVSQQYNLIIQNCCSPLIEYIISFDTPYLPLTGSFSDDLGNCWTLIGSTTDKINYIIRLSGPHHYSNCIVCINDNPCPENYVVESCCDTFDTIFSNTLLGVYPGDSFQDTFGFCWNVTGTTPAPIDGVVSVASVYSALDCTDCLSVSSNCPDIYAITSCCKSPCTGQFTNILYTTLNSLGAGAAPGITFRDQFGFCWRIALAPELAFTLLTGSFIQITDGADCSHISCSNTCELNVQYTLENCLTQEIEVATAQYGYSVNDSLLLITSSSFQPICFKIISWDLTSLSTIVISDIRDCFRTCEECLNP